MNRLSRHFLGCSAKGARGPSRHPHLALLLAAAAISGCGGGSDSNPQDPLPNVPPATTGGVQTAPAKGTGTLTVAVTDVEGRPLIDALVSVFDRDQTTTVGSGRTGSNGTVAIGSVPEAVRVYVSHEYGVHSRNDNVAVAKQGGTLLSVVMQADRPRPTVAILPVSIKPGSVSADRSELTLEVTLVASPAAPFTSAGYGDYSPESTPALGLALGQWDDNGQRQCFVWLDRTRTEPSCGAPWGIESPYTVSVERFIYDRTGAIPQLGMQRPARSALLLMDQSRRVAELDPQARRSFALRHFINRAIDRTQPERLLLAGFAGTDNSTASALPSQPLWLPLGAGGPLSTDGAALKSAVEMLEPYVGGTAPLFDALQAAIDAVAASAPSGDRAIVAMLGGSDDRAISEEARSSALAALQQQSVASRTQSILIVGAPTWSAERLAIAKLAAALHAPAISLGIAHTERGSGQSWAAGSFAAFELAADLVAGLPLPTLSATFRVKAKSPTAFLAGTTLHGVVYVESGICPMGCAEFPLEFAVEIP